MRARQHHPAEHWFHVSPFNVGRNGAASRGCHNPANDSFYQSGFGRNTGSLRDMKVRRDAVVWLSPPVKTPGIGRSCWGAHCYEVQPIETPRPGTAPAPTAG